MYNVIIEADYIPKSSGIKEKLFLRNPLQLLQCLTLQPFFIICTSVFSFPVLVSSNEYRLQYVHFRRT